MMKLPDQAELLRIYVSESDKYEGKPLYETIVLAARDAGLVGATVLRGLMGFGATSRIHNEKIFAISEDLPLVVEIVDTKEKIDTFLPQLQEIVDHGLITAETVRVVKHNAKAD